MPDPSPRPQPGLHAWSEWEAFLLGRDAEIAARYGVPVRTLTYMRESRLPAWEWFEYRLHTDPPGTDGRLSWEEKRVLRDADRRQRRARAEADLALIRTMIARGEERRAAAPAPPQDVPSGPTPPEGPDPAPPTWMRLTMALMEGLRRLTGPACVLALLYYVPVWLSHHALLPFAR